MNKVFICDDHAFLRRGLSDFISQMSGWEVVGEAGDHNELLQRLGTKKTDVLILDITLPEKNGFEVLKTVRKFDPSIKVIFFTMHLELPYYEKAIELGADAYVTKDRAPEFLEEALNTVMDGKKFFNLEKLEMFEKGGLSQVPKEELEKLSKREQEVLQAIVDGKSLTALSKELGLSVKTVSSHRLRLLEKLGLASNAELVRWTMGVPSLQS